MGGKSSSKSNQTTTSTTNYDSKQADASGVVSGDVLQGEITYTNEFGPEVQKAFSDLIALGSHALDITGDSFAGLIDLSNKSLNQGTVALNAVAQRSAQAETPGLSTIQSLIPIAMLALGGLVIVTIYKKGK